MKWLDPAWWKGLENLIGIQCPTDPEGAYRILRLRKDQHRIKVLQAQTLTGCTALIHALDHLPKHPIVIALSGEFIMERILPPDAAAHPVSAVLGVSVEDAGEFEWTTLPAAQDSVYVALIRTDALRAYAGRFGQHSSRVIAASYTQALTLYLLPQVGDHLLQSHICLKLDGCDYLLQEGTLATQQDTAHATFTTLEEATICTALEIPHHYAYLYAALLYTWIQSTTPNPSAESPLFHFQAHQRTSLLKNIAIVAAMGLGLWFAGLFSLRVQGERRKAALEEQYSQNLPVLNAIQGLDEKIAAREQLGDKLGSQTLKPSRASYYLDRIAARVPPEVKLMEIIIGPEEEDQKRQGIRDLRPQDILLRGESIHSAPIAIFSDALQRLEETAILTVAKSEMNFQSQRYEFVFLIHLQATAQQAPPR